jgi:curved DNA-binding protein
MARFDAYAPGEVVITIRRDLTHPSGVLFHTRRGRSASISESMPDTPLPDHYEVLQLSSRADQETIERVFRHLANRYHPDNLESGNANRFTEIVDAYRVLSDVEKRAQYDAAYEGVRETRWRIFGQDSATNDISSDARIRVATLSILYVARRNTPDEPGVGIVELERLLACPEPVMRFQMWYMRENGYVQRLESGHFAITAAGVDRLFEIGGPAKSATNLLTSGEELVAADGAFRN